MDKHIYNQSILSFSDDLVSFDDNVSFDNNVSFDDNVSFSNDNLSFDELKLPHILPINNLLFDKKILSSNNDVIQLKDMIQFNDVLKSDNELLNNMIFNLCFEFIDEQCPVKNRLYMVNKHMYKKLQNVQCCPIRLELNHKIYCKFHDKIYLYIYNHFKMIVMLQNIDNQLKQITNHPYYIYIHEDKYKNITMNLILECLNKYKVQIYGMCCDQKGVIINYLKCQKLFL